MARGTRKEIARIRAVTGSSPLLFCPEETLKHTGNDPPARKAGVSKWYALSDFWDSD